MKQGRHGAREDASLSLETVRLLKTQDAGYLRVMGDKVRKNMEELEREIRLQDGIRGALGEDEEDGNVDMDEDDEFDTPKVKKGGKIVFVGSVEEQRRKVSKRGDDEEDEDEDEIDDELDDAVSGKKEGRKTQTQIEEEERLLRLLRNARNKKKRAAEVRLRKLQVLRKQHTDIVAAERELDWQRARMENAVGGVNKNGVKWKVRERKR